MNKKDESLLKKEEAKVKKAQKTYAEKYPSLFAIAGAFGLVSTFYGFEKLIDKNEIFTNNPWMLLGIGITTLIVTGSFYNKL